MEKLSQVLADRPQSFSDTEKAMARANIGAAAVGEGGGGLASVSTDNTLTGLGTNTSPLGLANSYMSVPTGTGTFGAQSNGTWVDVIRNGDAITASPLTVTATGPYTTGSTTVGYDGIRYNYIITNRGSTTTAAAVINNQDVSIIRNNVSHSLTSKLSTVSTDSTLSGNGTTASPIGVNQPYLTGVSTNTSLTGNGTSTSQLGVHNKMFVCGASWSLNWRATAWDLDVVDVPNGFNRLFSSSSDIYIDTLISGSHKYLRLHNGTGKTVHFTATFRAAPQMMFNAETGATGSVIQYYVSSVYDGKGPRVIFQNYMEINVKESSDSAITCCPALLHLFAYDSIANIIEPCHPSEAFDVNFEVSIVGYVED